MYKKPLDIEVTWPCSCPWIYVLYVICKQLKFNIAAKSLKYETLWSMHLAALQLTSFLCEGWKEILWSLFSSSEDHHSSLVLSAVWQSPFCRPLSLNEKSILQPIWIYAGSKTSWCAKRNRTKVLFNLSVFRNISMSALEMMVISCYH